MSYENFTTYDELDAAGDITVTATRCTVDTMRHDAVAYLIDDKGVGHFSGDFEHLYTSLASAFSTNSAEVHMQVLAHIKDGDLGEVGTRIEQFFNKSGAGQPQAYIREVLTGTGSFQDLGSINISTPYYFTFSRVDTTFTVKIYTDSERTNLHDTLSLALHSTEAYRYIYAAAGMGTPWLADSTGSGYIEYLDLQETTTTTDKNIPNYFNSKYITHH